MGSTVFLAFVDYTSFDSNGENVCNQVSRRRALHHLIEAFALLTSTSTTSSSLLLSAMARRGDAMGISPLREGGPQFAGAMTGPTSGVGKRCATLWVLSAFDLPKRLYLVQFLFPFCACKKGSDCVGYPADKRHIPTVKPIPSSMDACECKQRCQRSLANGVAVEGCRSAPGDANLGLGLRTSDVLDIPTPGVWCPSLGD